MKRLSILLIALLTAVMAYSQNVTEKQALQKAQQFSKGKRLKPAPKMSQARSWDAKMTSDAFYVFNAEEGGFVIISGDDRTEEILGYSDSGKIDFDNMPENMRAWLEGYAGQIKSLGSNQTSQRIQRSVRPAVEPLIKTKWSQGAPYNWMCPEIDGQHCVTGCVATAMAQVMYYHRFPQEETYEFPSYNARKDWVIPALPPTTFEWDKMLSTYDNDYSKEEGDAVAKLMRYCGQAAQMAYGLYASSSAVGAQTMYDFFGFSSSAEDVRHEYYSTIDWENMMYQEIAEGRPILYSGQSFSDGHQFICDGYDGSGLFHINWGWAGAGDGYFLLSVLDPSNEGVGGGSASDGFSGSQVATINLKPREMGGTYPGPPVLYCHIASFGVSRIMGRNSKEDDFFVEFWSQVFAQSYKDLFEGRLAFVLYKDDVVLDTILWQENPALKDGNIRYWNISFGAHLDDGTYRLKFICDKDGNGDWRIPYSIEDRKVIIQGENLDMTYFGAMTLGEENFTVDSLSFDSNLVFNQQATAKMYITNRGETFEQELFIWIDGEEVSGGSTWIDPGHTGTLQLSFKPKSVGKKIIEITKREKKQIYYSDSVYINPPDTMNIIVDSISFDNYLVVNQWVTANVYITNKGEKNEQRLSAKLDGVEVSGGNAYIDPGHTGILELSIIPASVGKKKIEIVNNDELKIYYSDSVYVYPADRIFINSHYVHRGEKKIINVYLDCKDYQVEDYQFRLTLPNGISLTDEEDCKKQGISMSHNQDGSWSFKGSPKTLENGNELFSFAIIVEKEIACGSYSIKLDDVSCLSADGNMIKFVPIQSDICVGKEPSEIILDVAGTLSDFISVEEKYYIDHLKISGEINGTDLRLIRDMAGNNYLGEQTGGRLRELDLSEAHIVAGGEKYLDTDRIDGKNVTIIGSHHFTIEEENVLPKNVFSCLELKTVKLPEDLKTIGNRAFSNWGIVQELVIPHGIEEIEYAALSSCESLAKVILPSTIRKIGLYLFDDCTNLKAIVVSSKEPKYNLQNCCIPETATIIVPRGSKEKYLQSEYWKGFNIEERDFITIKADAKTMEANGEMPEFTYTVEGGTLEGDPHFYCDADGKTWGKYEIKLRQGTISNEYVIFENSLLIVKEPSSISSITVETESSNVFDIQGRKLQLKNSGIDSLPRGVYIINGKKVVK